jgi:hypothetical protein
MARIITKELALKIARKLGAAVSNTGGAHDLAAVYEDGVLIASFGIRRGSEKDKGHDHIPADIHVGPSFAKGLGQCPKSRQQWIEKLREKGILPAEDAPENPPAQGEPPAA